MDDYEEQKIMIITIITKRQEDHHNSWKEISHVFIMNKAKQHEMGLSDECCMIILRNDYKKVWNLPVGEL